MQTTKHRRLGLEALEDRWVPATIRFDGSNLTISNLNIVAGKSALTVTQQANGSFQVKDNGANDGSYFVTGNLTINGNNAKDTITVTLNKAAAGLPGNLYLTAGNGNDNVTLTTAGTGGTIGGNVFLNLGSGADLISVDPAGGAAASLSVGGSFNVSAKPGSGVLGGVGPFASTAHNSLEFNANSAAGQALAIGGSLNVTGIDELFVGIAAGANGSMSIGGNLNVQELAGSPAAVTPNGGDPRAYNYFIGTGRSAKIGGTVNLSATTGSTFVFADASVGGSLNANLGNGATGGGGANGAPGNVLDLNPVGITTMTIGGNVNFTSGNGNNALIFDNFSGAAAPTQIAGSVNVNFGNGANSVQLTDLTDPGAATVINGSFSYRAGNGSNLIGAASAFNNGGLATGAATLFDVSVLGSEQYSVGNGANTVAIGTAPGGAVSFNGGNGSDTFTLDNATPNGATPQSYFFNALFGNGPNTFTLGDTTGGGPVFVSGSAFGGTGTNLFVQNPNATPITGSFFLRNF